MSKLWSTTLAFGLALFIASTAQAQPVRVRAPAADDYLTTMAQCSAKLAQPHQRNACFACVKHAGRFNLSKNHCEGGAPPPPPPPQPGNAVLRSVPECNTIAFGPKRNRCVSCVSGNGVFFVQGNGYGFCKASAAPPPPPPPPVDRSIQRTVHECRAEIADPDKRLRCTTCIQGGGTYYKNLGNGHGQCTAPPPPAETSVLRTVSDCTAYLKGPRRFRCVKCIEGGGTFFRYEGKGDCEMPAPAPAPAMLRTAEECSAQLTHPKRRKQCLRCVGRGAAFQSDSGACVAPPAITSIDGCDELGPGLRKPCRKCVKKGGSWEGGSCHQD